MSKRVGKHPPKSNWLSARISDEAQAALDALARTRYRSRNEAIEAMILAWARCVEVPADLLGQLEALAEVNGRSLAQELASAVSRHLATPPVLAAEQPSLPAEHNGK